MHPYSPHFLSLSFIQGQSELLQEKSELLLLAEVNSILHSDFFCVKFFFRRWIWKRRVIPLRTDKTKGTPDFCYATNSVGCKWICVWVNVCMCVYHTCLLVVLCVFSVVSGVPLEHWATEFHKRRVDYSSSPRPPGVPAPSSPYGLKPAVSWGDCLPPPNKHLLAFCFPLLFESLSWGVLGIKSEVK